MKNTLTLKAFVFVLFIFSGIGLSTAQQAHVNLDWNPQKNAQNLTPFMANVISPEVTDDQMVTFRLRAPEAQEVSLSGGILRPLGLSGSVPFEKDADGLWTLTVGPVAPEIYKYYLVIDGVRVVDPNNTLVGFADQPGYSVVVVHGDGPAYYDAKDVPHGSVTRQIYHSDVTDGEREMYVYTPPGYTTDKEYPVLYLMGGSGELASTWGLDGRVNFIMDNLLAEGKALPMIIAMPNNQIVHRSDPDHTPKSFDLFSEELTQEVIPLIDSNYSTIKDRHGRAIAGLSMGGRHALIDGFRNLDMFASFGILSAAESFDLVPGVFDDPDLNSKVDYLFVGAGTNETTPTSRQAVLHEDLLEKGVEHEYYIGSAGAHDFITWKHLLYYRFLPNLWRQ